jgi:2-keto-3-deoxy-L-rhamnonate aldolase RhmA
LAEYRINKAKEKLRAGGVISIVNGVNDGDTVEIFGNLGFDAILAEGEHGPISWDAIGDISRSCDLWDMASIVRVHRNDPALVTRALDRGANGIMVPHVNTREEAELVARSSYYGPAGNRGAFGGRRAIGISDYHRKANENTLVTILLEDIIAIRNMKEIVKADGIDVFYVAPGDLAQSMGHTGDVSHPEVLQAVEDGLGIIMDAGRVAGTLVNDGTVEAYIAKGVRCVGMAWQPWLAAGATGFLERMGSHDR